MDYVFLPAIKSPDDLKKLNGEEITALCAEIRDCIINTVAENGGHLASNLGVVELTVALHLCFDSPTDSIIFDVGHQCYTHKLLTGRYDRFSSLRKEGGLSGYMRPDESEHDPVITGHSSNSISAAYGIAKAKSILHEDGYVVAVVGDGAMTGGMIYEALNNAGHARNKNNLIVILNDNKMSISGNVGALARYLNVIRTKPSYHRFKNIIERIVVRIPLIGRGLRRNIFRSKTMLKNALYPSNIFEGMGFNYMGPVDGHNIGKLCGLLKVAKGETRPVLIHVITKKGKGYEYAENNPSGYHGMSPFDKEIGKTGRIGSNFSVAAGEIICEMAEKDDRVCAVTAAMREGTGLYRFAEEHRGRFFDVGIAEQHAVTFSAGLASKGLRPVFFVYSSFLQRGYDQIIHDAAIGGVPLTLCIDRAGVVGDDGETHQGLFDVSFLSAVPGVEIYSPANFEDLRIAMYKAVYSDRLSAVRYPRGDQGELNGYKAADEDYTVIGNGKIAIVTYGALTCEAFAAVQTLGEEGIDCAVVKLNRVFPVSDELLNSLFGFDRLLFFEEGIKNGGIAELIVSRLAEKDYPGKCRINAVDGRFVPQSKIQAAWKKLGLDREVMVIAVREDMKH